MKLVVAVDAEWGIGNKGELLARVREDLRFFRKQTEGCCVILGSATLATFPGGKPLKNRRNLVLSRRPDFAVEGAEVYPSIPALLEAVKDLPSEEIAVIGGASVYRQMLPYVDHAFVTKFHRCFEKDVYFPNLDEDPDFECVFESEPMKTNPETDSVDGMRFCFTEYRRKKNDKEKIT